MPKLERIRAVRRVFNLVEGVIAARADLAMFLGLLFLLIVGAGRWSYDALLAARAEKLRVSGTTH